MTKLNSQGIKQNIEKLKGWSLEDNKIKKTFVFDDFILAMKFVNFVADLAEKQNHHPDISISYNKVKLTLWSHDVGGLTEKDFIFAGKLDKTY